MTSWCRLERATTLTHALLASRYGQCMCMHAILCILLRVGLRQALPLRFVATVCSQINMICQRRAEEGKVSFYIAEGPHMPPDPSYPVAQTLPGSYPWLTLTLAHPLDQQHMATISWARSIISWENRMACNQPCTGGRAG